MTCGAIASTRPGAVRITAGPTVRIDHPAGATKPLPSTVVRGVSADRTSLAVGEVDGVTDPGDQLAGAQATSAYPTSSTTGFIISS